MMRSAAPWRLASLALTLVGIAIAGYLTAVHVAGVPLVCGEGGGCDAVQTSRYARLGGVPVALFGLGMYLVVGALGLLRWRRPARASAATIVAFALALAGSIFAVWLTYLELAVIGAVCRWCVASAGVTVGLLAVEGIGVARLLAATATDGTTPTAGSDVMSQENGAPFRPRGAAGT